MTERIDAHHHLWRFSPGEFGWLCEPGYTPLQRDFLLPELADATQSAGVSGTVAVQARQTLEETRWLLQQAQATMPGDNRSELHRPLIRGVVGWAPLTDPAIASVLDDLRGDSSLKGLRHVVQGEPEGFLEGADFNRGIRAMRETGLVYDVLVFERQLREVIAFVDRHPGQPFVLDHIGKPRISAGEREPWATLLRELAQRDSVTCKISGLVTEADWTQVSLEQLRPYLDTVVEAFGPDRLMAGSDWPVCLVASRYDAWWELLTQYFTPFSENERDAIFGGVATRVYAL